MGDSLVHQEYGKTRAQWLASLNTEYKPPTQFRRTSIICTIGRLEMLLKVKAVTDSNRCRPEDQLR